MWPIPLPISLLRWVVFLMASAGSCAKRSSNDNNGRLSYRLKVFSRPPFLGWILVWDQTRLSTKMAEVSYCGHPMKSQVYPPIISREINHILKKKMEQQLKLNHLRADWQARVTALPRWRWLWRRWPAAAGGGSKVFFFFSLFVFTWIGSELRRRPV